LLLYSIISPILSAWVVLNFSNCHFLCQQSYSEETERASGMSGNALSVFLLSVFSQYLFPLCLSLFSPLSISRERGHGSPALLNSPLHILQWCGYRVRLHSMGNVRLSKLMLRFLLSLINNQMTNMHAVFVLLLRMIRFKSNKNKTSIDMKMRMQRLSYVSHHSHVTVLNLQMHAIQTTYV
jgi:hypothetical protein